MTNPTSPSHLPCSQCGAQPFQRCRSLRTNKTTNTHTARTALYRKVTS